MTTENSENKRPLETGIVSSDMINAASEHALTGTNADESISFGPDPAFPEGTHVLQGTDDANQDKTGRFNRLGRVLHAGIEDIREDDNKAAAIGWAGTMALTQVIDRSRMVLIFGPQLAIEAAEQTNNSLVGGLAVAGLFAVTNFGVGEALTQSMDRFPRAKTTFKDEYPKTVQLFRDSLAGVESKEIEDDVMPEAEQDGDKKKERDFLLPLKRAGTGIGIGSTAFVATSSVEGHSKSEVRKINFKVTRDTSVLITAVGYGVIEGIKRMYMQGWVDAADTVRNIVDDGKTWLGVAALSIVSTFISNRRAKKKMELEDTAPEQD